MKPLRILIVDDDLDFAESMAELVEMNGHEAILAFNGMAALKLFKQNNIDLILLDIRMPDLNGVETLKELNKMNPNSTVAMMTGYSDQPLLDDAIKLGAISILDKPVNLGQLKEVIDGVKKHNRILLLDDDKDFADSLSEILSNEGYEVFIADTINTAFQYAKNNLVDIFLLDLRINGKSGIDLWHMLEKENINTPVVFITGYADEFKQQITEIKNHTKVRVMEKPVETQKLITLLEAIA